ncbi:dermonecrotic toxin domain-containing protein [Pseudomonas inefficax]|uniref:dermonecrotic toxin domain-containing protein n=1 Tax=Pseudomonas inefficax TaxID=2078786 RepID=UPI004046A32D
MMSSQVPIFDFQQAVAQQFSDRPTLREVASTQLLRVLLAELPWLAYAKPALTTADPLMLDSPDPDTPYWSTGPFVDRILDALLDPQPLSIEALADGRHYNLGLTGVYRFAGSKSEFDTRRLSGLSPALNQLVKELPQRFCEAQLEYWRGKGSAGVSRDEWLQLLLKIALLGSLPWQGLEPKEQACIRGLLHGGDDQPPVYFVRTRLTSASLQHDQLQCQMLVCAEWDEREVILWCAPSGKVRSFDSFRAFGLALRDELAQDYAFEQMSWQRHAASGNVFAQQVSLLLDTLLERTERARYGDINDVPTLEQRFAQLSDPSSWFEAYQNDTPAVQPPPGLQKSSAQDSFACSAALLQIALYHLDSGGVPALDGIQSLTDYARQRLVTQIREEHGVDCSPDDLLFDLYFARGVPGGSATGAGGGEPLAFAGSKTLTEFAIGNLASLKGSAIERIYQRGGGAAPAWLDASSARALVTKMDIGRHYPAYVAAQLDDPARRAERVRLLGKEWRTALLAAAITAKLDGKIREAGLQCVVDYCAGHVDPTAPRMMLIPLVFKRSVTSSQTDAVRGMYILYCAEPTLTLLYRPLFAQDTLRQYASLPALLEHVRESKILQDSILDWMEPSVRAIYDHGGFREPHISFIGIDPYVLPVRPEPAKLAIEYWRSEIDEKLYVANRDLLLSLADEQSVSNAENRWQTLCEGAWLLFDVVTLVLRGPVAAAVWLLQGLASLQDDLQALERGDGFDRSAAVVDLMLNLSMVLLHARQPTKTYTLHDLPGAAAVEGPQPQRGAFAEIAVAPSEEMPSSASALPVRWLDFSWRGQSGFNWLPQEKRTALRAMRARVSLNGRQPVSDGAAAGLYRIDDNYYVALAGDAYRVKRLSDGVQVVDTVGTPGPWLRYVDGVWRVDTALRLRGGGRPNATHARLESRFRELREQVNQFDTQASLARKQFHKQAMKSLELSNKLRTLNELMDKEVEKQAGLPEGDSPARLESLELLQRYDDRKTEWERDYFKQRDRTLQQLEAAVSAEKAILPLLVTIGEPKYTSERLKGGWGSALAQHETSVREGLIRDNDLIINELWNLADYPELVNMQKALEGQPIDQVTDLYKKFRLKLESVVSLQERMLAGCEHLDQLLVDTADDFAIEGEPVRTVAQLIALRSFNTVQLRFHQVMNLADLALHLDGDAQPNVITGYREDLASSSLRNAADAHGELDFSNLSAQDRIVILQEAWDEYSAALLNSDRLRREGGALVEAGMIDRYREHINKLKLDAGNRLVEAAREQDDPSLASKRKPYVVSTQPQRLVRNAQGQLMIGTEIEVDGQPLIEVREALSDRVLATFEQVDGEWREREVKRPSLSDEAAPADLAMWVQSLLEESDPLRDKARSYVENDINGTLLAQVFDQQLDKLAEAASVVRDGGGSDALLRALEQEGDTLRAEKKLQLTTLYTKTNYPSAEALRFLFSEGLIRVEYSERRIMRNGTAFDEYRVQRLPTKRNLWAAHFHLKSLDDYSRNFTVGHLKTWSQRHMSSQTAAATGQRLHRGKLTLQQATGIIPFR